MEAPKDQINFFAKTNFRNREVPFGIKSDDRRRHMYVIGKTGMGKTTLMENMAIQDIRNGHGVCFMDPHGDSVVKILDFIPSDRVNDVVYFNPADLEFPIAFNIMESVEGKFKHLVASGLMGVFTKIWAGVWSARMEYILGNTVRALLESPGNSMLGITRMYIDKQYRKRIVDNIKDPMVRIFWTDEFANYDQKFVKEAIAPIQNKVGQFLSSAIIRNIVGQPKSTIDLREIMDNRKILLMDLSKGKVGEENAALLGAMIITKLQLAAMSRVDMREEDRPDFYLYVDEFQNFATESFATILSEARKYHLNLVMGHQYIGQLTPAKDNTRLRDAIFGNVGTMITFRIGAADAEYLETEFAPTYTPNDLVNLPKYNILLKLMINGVSSEPFSAQSIPVNPDFRTGNAEKVIRVSRERYGNPVEQVEERISRWMGAEFHQQAAVLAVADGDESGAKGIEAPVRELPVAVAPRQTLPERAPVQNITPVAPAPAAARPVAETSTPRHVVPTTPQVQKELAKPPVEESLPSSESLVYKMPEMPKPAPSQYTPNRSPQQAQPRSQVPQSRPVQQGSRQAQPARPAFSRPEQGRQNRNDKTKPRKSQPQKNAPVRSNIWDTVESLHEEKTVNFANKISSALGAVETKPTPPPSTVVPASAAPVMSSPMPAPARHEESITHADTHGKVVKPGEVHTF